MANETVSSAGVRRRRRRWRNRREMSSSPIDRVAGDLVVEWQGRGRYPPGPGGNTFTRTLKIARDPLPILLGAYEEYGPIFTLRLLHTQVVFMLGPEANHYVTVSHPENFHWRESSFGDLIPLLGDGLLTIDDDYHDHVRATMMPAFHREQVAASVEAMIDEATPAIEMLRSGEVVDIYEWMRRLAMRIAMRALLGLDPDEAGKGAAAAEHFERALEFYGIDFALRFLRGPGSPWRKMLRLAEGPRRDRLRRDRAPPAEPGLGPDGRAQPPARRPRRGGGGLLRPRGPRPADDADVRRPRHLDLDPDLHDVRAGAPPRRDREAPGGAGPGARRRRPRHREARARDALPRQVLDEVLRLYPPAWIGPRRAVREFEFNGHTVPEGAYLNYCSWASHRIPEFFPEPEAFRPERFTRERKAALPRGAYVPFGGGKRICIGKRFGQIEVKLVATMLLQRLRLDLLPGRTMTVRQMPTLSPKGGLRMRVDPRHHGA